MMVEMLLKSAIEINIQDNDENSALHLSIY